MIAVSIALVRDLMSIYGLRHSARSLWRVLTHSLLTARLLDRGHEHGRGLAMQAAHDRIAAAVAGTAGEALIVARRMLALGALAKAEIRPLPMRGGHGNPADRRRRVRSPEGTPRSSSAHGRRTASLRLAQCA